MSAETLKQTDLEGFTGSETWYRHGLVRTISYTDGAKYVADKGGAYWLLDEIALAQRFSPTVKSEPFQVWKLTVSDSGGVLACEDGNGNVVFTKHSVHRLSAFRDQALLHGQRNSPAERILTESEPSLFLEVHQESV
jgi:hypothetical protein